VFEKVASFGTLDSKPPREIEVVAEPVVPAEVETPEAVVAETKTADVVEPVNDNEPAEPAMKKAKCDTADEVESVNDTKSAEPTKKVAKFGAKGMGKRKEADFFYLDGKSELISSLAEYYGIPEEFNLDQVSGCTFNTSLL
jgi:hypothetical protein